jgi:putative oxygen-independent coproporphyrinogen III oxidase
MEKLAIYIHWPYCVSKCPYCDFNSHVANGIDHDIWRAAYRKELAYYAGMLLERRVTSIFFGGGTPSLMEAATVESILQDIAKHWAVDNDVEITLEANPNSVEAQKFADFRAAGVNRLSLGVQSLRDEALKFLGRAHDAGEARGAIELAAKNFPRFSFDLIYARKDQTPEAWTQELREALALADGHLSLYQLTIEPGTQFGTRHARGEELTAHDDNAARMYEMTQEILDAAGLPAYEISNHAKPGNESRHNLAYWHYDDYIGIGPGAHGRIRGQKTDDGGQKKENVSVLCRPSSVLRQATENHRSPDVWIKQVNENNHGLRMRDEIDSATAQREALMMGLRLTEGIDHGVWREKFGMPLAGDEKAFLKPVKVRKLEQEGYIENNIRNFRATAAGLQRLNAVLSYLID